MILKQQQKNNEEHDLGVKCLAVLLWLCFPKLVQPFPLAFTFAHLSQSGGRVQQGAQVSQSTLA